MFLKLKTGMDIVIIIGYYSVYLNVKSKSNGINIVKKGNLKKVAQ